MSTNRHWNQSPPLERSPIDASQICSVLYTSGTTGRPKGTVISNQALWAPHSFVHP
ncbi:MAG: AMP-binding protein [Acidimicrobiales bacterium]